MLKFSRKAFEVPLASLLMANCLSKEEVIAINLRVLKLSEDPHGVMNEANLTHLIEGMNLKYDGHADELILKAAFILDYLANKGHIFIEGNKRTAETATITFLRLNGFFFKEQKQDDLADFILKVAKNEVSLTAAARWLSQRIKRIE